MSDENNRPALPGPAVKRLHELLYEIADLNPPYSPDRLQMTGARRISL